jgi:hypothetical protein
MTIIRIIEQPPSAAILLFHNRQPHSRTLPIVDSEAPPSTLYHEYGAAGGKKKKGRVCRCVSSKDWR